MITITNANIQKVYSTAKKLDLIVPQLNELCKKYNIDTTNRLSMFIAQCLHESAGFLYLKEIWGNTKWQIAYENNIKLGNINPGDGKLFMGRGLIQLTGRSNYTKFSKWAGNPEIINTPSLVETPEFAVLSAIWFWDSNNLNKFADNDDIEGCTKAVNGKAMLGLNERSDYYSKLKKILK